MSRINLKPFSNHILKNSKLAMTIIPPFHLLFNQVPNKQKAMIRNQSSKTFSASEKAMTRKPTPKCDPYGQNGKPLSSTECTNLLTTLDPEWKLLNTTDEITMNKDLNKCKVNGFNPINTTNESPLLLYREFNHIDYINAMHFMNQMSFLSINNNHYPKSISINHSIGRSKRCVKSIIQLHTDLLCGLSFNDFHLATMIDVEIQRDGVKHYILD